MLVKETEAGCAVIDGWILHCFPDVRYHVFKTALDTGKLEIILVFEVVIDETFIDAGSANGVDGATPIAVMSKLFDAGIQNAFTCPQRFIFLSH